MKNSDIVGMTDALMARTERVFPFCKQWTLSEWCVALSSEAGELSQIAQRLACGREVPKLKARIAEECADIIAYTLQIAQEWDVDITLAFWEKFRVISGRVQDEEGMRQHQEAGSPYGLAEGSQTE